MNTSQARRVKFCGLKVNDMTLNHSLPLRRSSSSFSRWKMSCAVVSSVCDRPRIPRNRPLCERWNGEASSSPWWFPGTAAAPAGCGGASACVSTASSKCTPPPPPRRPLSVERRSRPVRPEVMTVGIAARLSLALLVELPGAGAPGPAASCSSAHAARRAHDAGEQSVTDGAAILPAVGLRESVHTAPLAPLDSGRQQQELGG